LSNKIPPPRRIQNQREQPGDLLGSEGKQDHAGHVRDAQRLAESRRKLGEGPAAVEVVQRGDDGLAPQVVARADVVEDRAPAAGAQRVTAAVLAVSNGARAGNYDDAGVVADGGVHGDGGVGGKQVMAGGDGLAQPFVQLSVDGRAVHSRQAQDDCVQGELAVAVCGRRLPPSFCGCLLLPALPPARRGTGAERRYRQGQARLAHRQFCGAQNLALGGVETHLERVRGTGDGAREDFAALIGEPRRCPSSAAVDAENVGHGNRKPVSVS